MILRCVLKYVIGYIVGFNIFLFGILFGLYLASIMLHRYLPVCLVAQVHLRLCLSFLIAGIGIAFVVWSNLWLFFVGKGGPADGFGVHISPRTKYLVTSGPYCYTRNPMVFGTLSFYLALAVFFNSTICLGLVAALSFGASIYLKTVEEKRLLKDFGDAYEKYRQYVSMLVPLPPRKKK